jgi:cell division protease FtsH
MNLKNHGKSIALWVILALFLVAIFNIYHSSFKTERNFVSLSDFIREVNEGRIKEVTIKEQDIAGITQKGTSFVTYAPRTFDPIPLLLEKGVRFTPLPQDAPSFSLFALFQILFPLIVFGGIWFFFFRQIQSSNGRTLGFGRSRAKLSDPEKNLVTFADVEGIDEAKEDLKEVVEFLRDPRRFQKIGGRIPRGVLLVGPPGTGKTLLAKAVAGEARVPFFSISGSDFVEMFVGVGASRVRDLFVQAKQHAPCIVFIDEIDAVGRHRGAGMGGGNDEREQTLNQLLVEMDGFDANEGIIVIAATNRSDVLDAALLRPGRFDRRIIVNLPDIKGREKILASHIKKIRTTSDVSLRTIARGTPGFSGADLANLVNESALLAARHHKKAADMHDFEASRDKILMGPERRSFVFAENDRKLTAFHEAGHAVVAYHSEQSDPIHKVTIIPRGMALGMVQQLPENDRTSRQKSQFLSDIAIYMGGRIAEELTFGPEHITSGASSDLKGATHIAKKMVTEWGMSDEIGPVSYPSDSSGGDFYNFLSRSKEISDDTMKLIDSEIKKFLKQGYDTAKAILLEHSDQLELVANTLLERETLTGEEVHILITKGKLKPLEAPETPPKKAKPAIRKTSVRPKLAT